MLKVTGLAKSFTLADGGSVPAVDDVGFTVDGAQCFALLGPSGCGKTTAMMIDASAADGAGWPDWNSCHSSTDSTTLS